MTTKIYKGKKFNKFTRKERIDDADLIAAIEEVENGLVDADLGGQVYKKRLAKKGQGKRGGYRTIILLKRGERAIIAHAFAKNDQANISDAEEEFFKLLAAKLLKLTDEQFEVLVAAGEYFEVVTEQEVEEDDEEI